MCRTFNDVYCIVSYTEPTICICSRWTLSERPLCHACSLKALILIVSKNSPIAMLTMHFLHHQDSSEPSASEPNVAILKGSTKQVDERLNLILLRRAFLTLRTRMTRLRLLHLEFLHTLGDTVELSRLRLGTRGIFHRQGLVVRIVLWCLFSRASRGRVRHSDVLGG